MNTQRTCTLDATPTRYTFFIDAPLCRRNKDGGLALLIHSVDVEMRGRQGDARWAVVVDGGCVLNADGETEHEPLPSGRDDAFLARTRFALADALLEARKFIRRHEEYAPEPPGRLSDPPPLPLVP